jgi:hypothetical protein
MLNVKRVLSKQLRVLETRRSLDDKILEKYDFQKHYPKLNPDKLKEIYNYKKEEWEWESCYMRRLHGESLLGYFWQEVERVYLKGDLYEWSAASALSAWCGTLLNYWNCGEKYYQVRAEGGRPKYELQYTKREPKVVTLLTSCPIMKPFVPTNESSPNFDSLELDADLFKKLQAAPREFTFEKDKDCGNQKAKEGKTGDQNQGTDSKASGTATDSDTSLV